MLEKYSMYEVGKYKLVDKLLEMTVTYKSTQTFPVKVVMCSLTVTLILLFFNCKQQDSQKFLADVRPRIDI